MISEALHLKDWLKHVQHKSDYTSSFTSWHLKMQTASARSLKVKQEHDSSDKSKLHCLPPTAIFFPRPRDVFPHGRSRNDKQLIAPTGVK